MKKILLMVFLLLVAWSCEKESFIGEPSLDQILKGKDVGVYKGILTFKDNSTFDKFSEDLSKKDKNYVLAWGRAIGFKSIYSIYEDVNLEEGKFLDSMEKKYGEDSELTRNELGYSELTQKYLDKGVLIQN